MTMTAESVRKSITVEASQERAFKVFTEGFGSWWPLDSHSLSEGTAKEAIIEGRVGGRLYEIGPDGSEIDWGKVLAFEPPRRIVLGWQLNADWRYDHDFLTEVEVRFIAEGDSRTRVELEHRDLERYGERMEEIRASISSDEGWTGLLRRFADAAAA